MAGATFESYAWRPLASAPAPPAALPVILAARGTAVGAGGIVDDTNHAGIHVSQTMNSIFMWGGGWLTCYDVANNVWLNNIPLPAGFVPTAFAPLHASKYSLVYDQTTRNVYQVDFDSIRVIPLYDPGAGTFDCFAFLTPPHDKEHLSLNTFYHFAPKPVVYSMSRPGFCCMPVESIFGATVLLVFDYRERRAYLHDVIAVGDNLVRDTSRQNGGMPGLLGSLGGVLTCLPGRIYHTSSTVLTRIYRRMQDFADQLTWSEMNINLWSAGWFSDDAHLVLNFAGAIMLSGFPGSTGGAMYNALDTNFEATLNALVQQKALSCIGFSQIETAVQGVGGRLSQVQHFPFDLTTQAFKTPLTANVPAGFGTNPAFCIMPMFDSVAILDDAGQFFLLEMVQYDFSRVDVTNWGKDIRA